MANGASSGTGGVSNVKFFGRKYKLSIKFADGMYTFETPMGSPAMDIKFDCTYAKGQTAREGIVSILGLSREHINQITKLSGMTRGKAMSELVRLKLEAGYFTDAGMVEILNGFVWYGTVTAPPNMWLTMKVSEYNPMGGKKIQNDFPKEALPVKEAVGQILGLFSKAEGYKFELVDKTQDKLLLGGKLPSVVLDLPSEISLSDAIVELNRQCSHDVQFLLRTRGESIDSKTRHLLVLDKAGDKVTPVGDAEVDGDNGLLSVTGIDAVNGCVTTFLDGRIDDELSHLKLSSKLNPHSSGRYYIIKKQFVGHYLGQEWYARYFCSDRVTK